MGKVDGVIARLDLTMLGDDAYYVITEDEKVSLQDRP